MKILIVSAFPTHPTTAGNLQWILTQATLLIKAGHEVHYLWVETVGMSSITQWQKDATAAFWGDRLHILPASKKDYKVAQKKEKKRNHSTHSNLWECDEIYPVTLSKYVQKLNANNNFEACIVQYFYLTKLFDEIDIPIKVLSTHDSFAYRNLRVNDNSLYLTASEEAKAMQRATHILALQESERNYFEHLSPLSKTYTVYNYYPFHYSEIIDNKNILFLSSKNPYNINGIKWFIDEVLPLIVEDFPTCKLIIGGMICEELSSYAFMKNIELQGYVDNAEKFYSQGDVAINPVFQGTGLKIKTFEAISYDKVVITHPHSQEGIFRKEEAPLLSSEKGTDWPSLFHSIWDNKNEIQNIKKKNRQYIEKLDCHILAQYSSIFNSSVEKYR